MNENNCPVCKNILVSEGVGFKCTSCGYVKIPSHAKDSIEKANKNKKGKIIAIVVVIAVLYLLWVLNNFGIFG